MSLSHSASAQSLDSRLAAYPELKTKIETLVSVVENANGDLSNAHQAEQQVINEVQKLGQTALQEWANQEQERQQQHFWETEQRAQRCRKKHSTGTADLGSSGLTNKPLP